MLLCLTHLYSAGLHSNILIHLSPLNTGLAQAEGISRKTAQMLLGHAQNMVIDVIVTSYSCAKNTSKAGGAMQRRLQSATVE